MIARKSLEQLFDLLFGAEDLKRFLEKGLSSSVAEDFQANLPTSPDRVRCLVEALELNGAVTNELFDELVRMFPERSTDIETVARACLCEQRVGTSGGVSRPIHCARVPEHSDGVWDVFLAHAGPDGAAADQLYELLSERGWSVFLDSRCLRLGARWDDAIPKALNSARLVVVLVSQRTRDAWYAREEIAMAIDLARGPGAEARVVPVYLSGLPENGDGWLYGLKRLHGLVASEIGWPSGVAERLDRDLEDEQPPSRGTGGQQPHSEESRPPAVPTEQAAPASPATYLHYLNVAMDLDRSDQWRGLVDESRSDTSGMFLVYGQRRQNVELFVARLWNYLNDETDRHHKVISVPSRWERALPRSAPGWEINLRHALEEGEGTAAERLRELARHQPVFLVFCEYPLSRDGLDDDEEVITALEGFLEDRLPSLIHSGAAEHPIRALVVTDHERDEESLEGRLDARMMRGAERHGIRYRRLQEVEHVQWSHVKAYLDGLHKRPENDVYRAIRNEYDRLDHERISFQELADRLSRRL